MRKKNRYFIFIHESAFAEGILAGLVWRDGGLTLAAGKASGLFLTPVLDARERGNLWQRVLLRASRPVDGKITCRFYSVDLPYEAQALSEIMSDPDRSLAEKLAELARFEVFAVENADDFLLRGVKGRYLIAALELYRQGAVSPVIWQLRIFASQESFLGYLPEIFQEEGGFLDRYLRLFSVQYLEMEREISRLPASFDPQVAPPGLLYWLAEIMGIPHIELWEADNLRRLLASRVYTRKGTLAGLGDLIEIYTGFAPYIVESFRMRTGIDEADSLYGGCRLLILMPSGSVDERRPADALHMLIQTFISHEINYKLIVLEDRARISDYTYLDVNACLTDYSPAVLEKDARIGYAILGG